MNIRRLATRIVIGAVIVGSFTLYAILKPDALLASGSASDYYLPTATSPAMQTLTTNAQANVYEDPDLTSSVIGRLASGQQVSAECGVGPNGEWCDLSAPFDFLSTPAPTDPDYAAIATAFAGFNSAGRQEAWVWGGCLQAGSDCR
jgi:hypothetical protein